MDTGKNLRNRLQIRPNMLFITHRLQAYFLKIASGRWSLFTSMHCCKRVWKLPYTRLRRSLSIAANSSTVSCLSSWIVMICHWNTWSYRNPHRKKSGTVRLGNRAAQAVAETSDNSSEHFTNNSHTVLYHMKWCPLLYRSPSRQPRQAIAPAQYSNSKCVSRLHATLYHLHKENTQPLHTSTIGWNLGMCEC